MEAQKVEDMAKRRMDKEELEKAEEERSRVEKIPQFASYFWLGGKIREGQSAKGFMGMADCELFLGSMQAVYNFLKNVVKHEANPTAEENLSLAHPELADGLVFHAFHVLKTVMESLTNTGFLSIEDAAEALGHLKRIQQTLVENIDPEFEKEQMKASLEEKMTEMKNQRKPKNKGKNKPGRGKK